jgi:hypothetical protein
MTGVDQGEGLGGADKGCSQRLKFGEGAFAVFVFESLDCVFDYEDAAAAIEQSFGSEANAIFCYDAEDNEFGVVR